MEKIHFQSSGFPFSDELVLNEICIINLKCGLSTQMGFVSSGFDMIQSLGSPRAGFFLTVASSNNLKPILNQNFDDGESRIFLQQS